MSKSTYSEGNTEIVDICVNPLYGRVGTYSEEKNLCLISCMVELNQSKIKYMKSN